MNEQRENENLLPQQKNNLGKKILKGSLYVTTILMVVSAFAMSAVAIQLSLSHSHHDIEIQVVKYTTYERIGNTECPNIPGTSLIYSGITISYSFNSTQNTPTSYSGFRCMPTDNEDINYYMDNFI